MFGVTLSRLPRTARWLLTLMLASFALNHLFASAMIWQATRGSEATAKEFFAYKSLEALLRMAHQHVFGHGVMYFLTAGVFLFAGWPERWTLLLITAPFVGAWLDLASWFLLKYGSEKWEYLSAAAGVLFSASFAVMLLASLKELWLARDA